MPLTTHLILFAAGLVAGILNTVGGGGSMLTLPALIFAGVPPVAANGTNRIGIIAQSLVAVWRFKQGGVYETTLSWRVILVGLPFAAGGALLATWIPDAEFERLLGVLMLVLLALILSRPKPRLAAEGEAAHDVWAQLESRGKLAAVAGFAALGFYAGFIQAGGGILILVLLGWVVRIDLVRANYIKLLFILVLNLLVLAVFWGTTGIHWMAGLSVTAGQVAGAWAGSFVALKMGEKWMLAILTVAILLSSSKLLGLW